MIEKENVKSEASQEKQNAILAALAKAGGEAAFSDNSDSGPGEEGNGYYVLTREEVAALLNGNVERIESWVSNLDRRHATSLLRWFIKESG